MEKREVHPPALRATPFKGGILLQHICGCTQTLGAIEGHWLQECKPRRVRLLIPLSEGGGPQGRGMFFAKHRAFTHT